MPVYMIQAGGNRGPVKIGFGLDPEDRLRNLQTGNHLELRIIRMFDGGEAEESALHARFIDLHIRGEWHSFSMAMLGDVGLVEIKASPDIEDHLPEAVPPIDAISFDARAVGARLHRTIRAKGMTQDAAAQSMGANQAVFSRWCRGERLIPATQAVKLGQALDIPLHELRPDLWAAPQASDAA